MQEKKKFNPSIAFQFTFSFIIVALIGSFLLALPIFQQAGLNEPYLAHLLTAVSLVCVSGMAALPIAASYNLAGQIIALALIQIGGLGVITIINYAMHTARRKLSLKNQYLIQQSFARDTNEDFSSFLTTIYRYTFAIELLGALILSLDFIPRYGFFPGIFHALFISVSAFTNSGFHNLNTTGSLEAFYDNPLVLLTVAGLVIVGGLGFPVIFELKQLVYDTLKEKPFTPRIHFRKISLHSRLVLQTTSVLLVSGTVTTLIAEYFNPDILDGESLALHLLNAFFQSANTRTAGYTTLTYESLQPVTKFLSMVLTIIGGAPGGTAGGIKVTTFAVILLMVRAELKSYSHVTYHKRVIPNRTLRQAVLILVFFLILLLGGYTILLMLHPNLNALDVLFEVCNALGSAGISLNLTAQLSLAGKIILIILMIGGRVGATTLLVSVLQRKDREIKYAPGHIYLG